MSTTITETTETKPPPKPTARMSDDPFMARVLGDIGKIVEADGTLKDVVPDPKAEPTHPASSSQEFTTMGEIARFKAEKTAAGTPAKKEGETAQETPEQKANRESDEKAAKEAEEAKKKEEAEKAASADKKKIVVEKAKPIEEIVEGITRRVLSEQAQDKPKEAEKKVETKTQDPDAAYIQTLQESQRDEIALAEFAAKKDPEHYGQMRQRTISFFKKVDEYIDQKRKEDADWDPEQDEGFAEYIEEHKPTYNPGDRRKLERAQITDEVTASVKASVQPEVEEVKRSRKREELKPELDAATVDYQKHVVARLALDEKSPLAPIIKTIAEKGSTEEGWTQAKAVDPLATKIVKRFSTQAAEFGREVMELSTQVAEPVTFNPKLPADSENNLRAARQQRLFAFIDSQEDFFNKNGGQMKVKDGRNFVPRRQFFALSPEDQAKHWTLGAQDVLDMLAIDAALQAQNAYTTALKEREEEGYVRPAKKEEAKTEKTETKKEEKKAEETASPKATSTPGPGAGTGAPPPSSPTVFTPEELEKQWGGGKATWV